MYTQTPISLLAERELIHLLNKGDKSAFEKLYHLYSVRLLKKLMVLLKDEQMAREVLQDVFLAIWEKRDCINPDKPLRSYLFRIAENKIVDVFRKAARDKKLMERLVSESVTLSSQTEDIVAYKESNIRLQQAISNLPPQRKKIFVLCRVEGKTYGEVSTMLGISPGTVNDHMVKAMRTIRACFRSGDLAILLFLVLLNR